MSISRQGSGTHHGTAPTPWGNWGSWRRLPIFALIPGACLLLASCKPGNKPSSPASQTEPEAGRYAHAQRIVSLSPALTEMLFALELGDRVVGVTRFCDYPPEARSRATVGGFYDTNLEALVALEPDLVVLLDNHQDAVPGLASLKLHSLPVRCNTLDDVFKAIHSIGAACGVGDKATSLVNAMQQRVEAVRGRCAAGTRPRVMICVGRTLGSGTLQNVYIAGQDGFYDQLLAVAGALPAYDQPGIRFPLVSQEGIIELNPEVIIDLAPDLDATTFTSADLLQDWQTVPSVAAVKNGRAYVLTGDHVTIPGPRCVVLLEELAEIIHPDQGQQP